MFACMGMLVLDRFRKWSRRQHGYCLAGLRRHYSYDLAGYVARIAMT
jgi:hypothetical protein